MYWIYNVLLIFYWIGLIPVILYRLAFEDGFYERIKQSAGYMPATLLKKIEGRRNSKWLLMDYGDCCNKSSCKRN